MTGHCPLTSPAVTWLVCVISSIIFAILCFATSLPLPQIYTVCTHLRVCPIRTHNSLCTPHRAVPYRIGHCCCMHVRLQQRFHHVQPRVVLGGAMQRQVAMQRNSNNHEHYEGRQQQYKADSSKALCCCLLPLHHSFTPPPPLSQMYTPTHPSSHLLSLAMYITHEGTCLSKLMVGHPFTHTHEHVQ